MTSRRALLPQLTMIILCGADLNTAHATSSHERPRALAEARATLVIDARHGHNRYYPAFGSSVRSLERGYVVSRFHGVPYYFRDGIWYRTYGRSFIVVRPPIGTFVTVLPAFYTTLWFGGTRYYYADNVYYRWDTVSNGYLVSEPPQNLAATTTNSVAPTQTFVYPKNGQSVEQQNKDRYECYRWAADQSGFDPTKVGGGTDDQGRDGAREAYNRAQAACLEARGYSVK